MTAFLNLINMCVAPIEIYTRSKTLPMGRLKPYRMLVPCGHCYQCREKNAISWSVRSYYEIKDCLESPAVNGVAPYMLFDTLTYDDINVPRYFHHYEYLKYYGLGNEMCFNKKHVQDWLKLLRIRLERLGYDVSENLRYIICSEYGLDDRYTHRPHYHVYFFVTCGVPPLVLSKLISDSWKFGRTDGIPFKSKSYVMSNRVFSKFNAHAVNAAMYVQKYISKGSPYDRKVIKDIYKLVELLGDEIPNMPAQRREFIKFCIKKFTCWHIQSKSFGRAFYEKYYDGQQNTCVLNYRKNSVTYEYDLPKYYVGKIFKYDAKTFGGSVRRFKTDSITKKYLQYRFKRLITNQLNELSQALSLPIDDQLKRLVLYNTSYRGRIGLPSSAVINEETAFNDYYYSLVSDDGFNDQCTKVFVYAHPIDVRRFGRPIVSFQYLGRSSNSGKVDVPFEFTPCEAVKSLDSSNEQFKGLDELNEIYQPYLEMVNEDREASLMKQHRFREKWKKILYQNSNVKKI